MTLFIVGAGGFGRETYDAVLAARDSASGSGHPGNGGAGHGALADGSLAKGPLGNGRAAAEPVVFCDHALAGEKVRGLPVVHPDEVDDDFVVAISDPDVRARFSAEFEGRGLNPRTVVHPRALIGPETVLGAGSVVLAMAYVSSSCVLGRHVQISYNATLGHDCRLSDVTTVLPGANVAGSVHLATGATVGSNAFVRQGLTVGAGAFVGAGAVVTRDVTPRTVVVGVPARPQPR